MGSTSYGRSGQRVGVEQAWAAASTHTPSGAASPHLSTALLQTLDLRDCKAGLITLRTLNGLLARQVIADAALVVFFPCFEKQQRY